MGPFRVQRQRILTQCALEAGLILAVLYGLALLTTSWVAESARPAASATIWLAGGLYTAVLFATRWTNAERRASMVRETAVFALFSSILGLIGFGSAIAFSIGRWPAMLLLQAAVAVPAAVALWRWIISRFGILALPERVLVVGTGEKARELVRWMAEHRAGQFSVVGFADEDESRLGAVMAAGARIQTDYDSLGEFAPFRTDRVIVALDEKRGKLPVRPLLEVRLRGIEVEEATTFVERMSGRISVETMLPSWLIFSDGFKTSRRRVICKRIADLVLSLVLLVLSAPIMLLTAVLIRLEGRGPILYRQERIGLNGREINVLKFRSMIPNAERHSGPVWATEDDPRVTRVGRVIRKLRVDELPQLFNVLRGEMSFVGPRPERGHFVHRLEEKLPYYSLRRTVRPGITGWAQVEYGYGATDEDALEKLKYDLYYIKNATVFFDLWIVLKTVRVVLMGRGAR